MLQIYESFFSFQIRYSPCIIHQFDCFVNIFFPFLEFTHKNLGVVNKHNAKIFTFLTVKCRNLVFQKRSCRSSPRR